MYIFNVKLSITTWLNSQKSKTTLLHDKSSVQTNNVKCKQNTLQMFTPLMQELSKNLNTLALVFKTYVSLYYMLYVPFLLILCLPATQWTNNNQFFMKRHLKQQSDLHYPGPLGATKHLMLFILPWVNFFRQSRNVN